jgi:hypothetical protein
MKSLKSILVEKIKKDAHNVFRGIKINTEFDIPYLAGYGLDSKTVYIDRDFPRELKFIRFIVIHEVIEDLLESILPDEHYQDAHKIATKVEHHFVKLAGIDPAEYESILRKYVEVAGKKELTKCPPDLDLQPYQDSEDYETIKRIQKAQHNE